MNENQKEKEENSPIDLLADSIVDKLASFWENKAKDFVISEAGTYPYNQVSIEFTAYNFMIISLRLEAGAVWFYQLNNGILLRLHEKILDIETLPSKLTEIDKEIRLRIPDKYLKAKGF